jgi:iron complex outermembrane receptor protein
MRHPKSRQPQATCLLMLCALLPPLARADADEATHPRKTTNLEAVKAVAAHSEGFAPKRVNVGPYQGQDILNVPATVNVVTRDLIDAQAAAGMYDALRNVAGVSRQQLNGLSYDNLSIRGISLDNRASYYFNGVLPFDNNIAIPMEDKESFEVLKGAAALYYGYAVPGGIVNMTTRRAGDTPVTRVGTSYDSNGSAKLSVDLARRFGTHNQFGVRVNAADQNVHTPINKVDGGRRMVSLAADWRVNSRLLLKYDYEHVEQNLPEQAGITPLAAVNGKVTLPRLPAADELLPPSGYQTRSRADTHLLRADYVLSDNWAGMVSAGQSTTRRDRWLWIFRNYNVNTGTGQLQGSKQNGQIYRNRNLRAEINGVLETGPITHNVTVGASRNQLYQPDFTTYYYVATQNLYDPINVTSIKASGTPKVFYAQTVWNSGTYAFDRMAIGQQWEFTGGLRRSTYESSQLGSVSTDVSKNTPSASLVYKLDTSTSIYASYIEGLESAGSAPGTAANAYQSLPAAVSRQSELGLRHRYDNDALVSVAYFDIRQPSANLDSDNVYRLDGWSRYRGVEASAQGHLGPQLSLSASAMWLHARQTQATDPTLVGKTPENTPRVTASVFAEYALVGAPGLAFNLGAFYTAARPINNADQAWIGGYTLFSTGASYTMQADSHPIHFQINIENLANKRYWSAAGSSQLAVGLGRTAMFSTTFDF